MAKITSMIDNLTGQDAEKQRTREQFAFLQKMARAKSQVFEDELKLMLASSAHGESLEIVGSKAFEYHHGQHVNITKACDDAIMDAVNEFFKGKAGVKEGFKTIVKQGLSGIIGDTTIGEVEDSMFFVFPENYSIVRVDVKAYKYTFSSKDIFAKDVENVFVYTMCKSIVDHTKVGVDYLMHTVVDMMRKDPNTDPDLSQVMDFIRELIACWQLLDSVSASPRLAYSSAQASAQGLTAAPMYVNQEVRQLKSAIDNRVEDISASRVLRVADGYEGE